MKYKKLILLLSFVFLALLLVPSLSHATIGDVCTDATLCSSGESCTFWGYVGSTSTNRCSVNSTQSITKPSTTPSCGITGTCDTTNPTPGNPTPGSIAPNGQFACMSDNDCNVAGGISCNAPYPNATYKTCSQYAAPVVSPSQITVGVKNSQSDCVSGTESYTHNSDGSTSEHCQSKILNNGNVTNINVCIGNETAGPCAPARIDPTAANAAAAAAGSGCVALKNTLPFADVTTGLTYFYDTVCPGQNGYPGSSSTSTGATTGATTGTTTFPGGTTSTTSGTTTGGTAASGSFGDGSKEIAQVNAKVAQEQAAFQNEISKVVSAYNPSTTAAACSLSATCQDLQKLVAFQTQISQIGSAIVSGADVSKVQITPNTPTLDTGTTSSPSNVSATAPAGTSSATNPTNNSSSTVSTTSASSLPMCTNTATCDQPGGGVITNFITFEQNAHGGKGTFTSSAPGLYAAGSPVPLGTSFTLDETGLDANATVTRACENDGTSGSPVSIGSADGSGHFSFSWTVSSADKSTWAPNDGRVYCVFNSLFPENRAFYGAGYTGLVVSTDLANIDYTVDNSTTVTPPKPVSNSSSTTTNSCAHVSIGAGVSSKNTNNHYTLTCTFPAGTYIDTPCAYTGGSGGTATYDCPSTVTNPTCTANPSKSTPSNICADSATPS
jgi:hypothetical protein